MLSKQATITLTASTDPTGVGVTLDDLRQFMSAVHALEHVQSIELHAGELVAVGTEAVTVRPPLPTTAIIRTMDDVPLPRTEERP